MTRKRVYTLLKSDVTTRDHVVRCRGSQECGSRNVNFACKFHRRSHRVRITLKSTTFLFMRSKNVWTTKPWQRSEWPLDFNSVLGPNSIPGQQQRWPGNQSDWCRFDPLKNGVRLTQFWVIFRIKLTDFRVIVETLTRNGVWPQWTFSGSRLTLMF